MPRRGTVHRRTESRRRALDVLFVADLLERSLQDVLEQTPEIDKTGRAIVEGVAANREQIDGLIREYADRWTLERMPVVDRNLLRIGIYEVSHASDVPPGAAINDLVELAKMLSTEDSGRFVNGMLGRVARSRGH